MDFNTNYYKTYLLNHHTYWGVMDLHSNQIVEYIHMYYNEAIKYSYDKYPFQYALIAVFNK